MNRALFAIGVGVVGLSMAVMGCATGVDDPVPTAPTPVPSVHHDPPEQTLSGVLIQPRELDPIAEPNGTPLVNQLPPIATAGREVPQPAPPSERPE